MHFVTLQNCLKKLQYLVPNKQDIQGPYNMDCTDFDGPTDSNGRLKNGRTHIMVSGRSYNFRGKIRDLRLKTN